MPHTLETLTPEEIVNDPKKVLYVLEQSEKKESRLLQKIFREKIKECVPYFQERSIEIYAEFENKLLGYWKRNKEVLDTEERTFDKEEITIANMPLNILIFLRYCIIKKNSPFLREIQEMARGEQYGNTYSEDDRSINQEILSEILRRKDLFYEGARKYQIFADNEWGENVERVIWG